MPEARLCDLVSRVRYLRRQPLFGIGIVSQTLPCGAGHTSGPLRAKKEGSTSNTNLKANTTYRYRVRAYNAAGNSGYSNIATATTPKR